MRLSKIPFAREKALATSAGSLNLDSTVSLSDQKNVLRFTPLSPKPTFD
jgi:hypothetical protein